MSDFKDEEEGKSLVPSCLSLKSDRSRGHLLYFRDEPGPSNTKQRAESPVSRWSLKSDRSKQWTPDFSNEPGPSDTKGKRKSGVPVEEQLSSCALCQDVLKDPVSTSCGHWFCRQCITSYWEQRPSIRRPLLSPVWRKIQNQSWPADSQSDQLCTSR
ncbi:hypothetical protein OYC64_014080 [Pagothenia borchgrevinki]|uniref:RING-type domain-containing protein n=1 Tax=Pagothenia borchgrevinki TaxID=8213 RepID=A0ABD2FW76_PAGBO